MGKISPVSAKYIIYTKIEIEGTVERPDVIGAIFGQTEGLLGSELELRELQRSGKIGRIEVKLDFVNGKTAGSIVIPSSMDQAETAIIAASLETIERIGPCNSKVVVQKIEDVRISKRDFVVDRAKALLRNFKSDVMPDSQEITDIVAKSVRMMEIVSWGPEKLSAGPAVTDSDEIIVVEGRADVLNLLKHGIKNAIALNGTSVPNSIKGLCRKKDVTVFVDGDRGGDLIIRELMATTDIDYVVKAPDGKELEELTKKEIHIALRNKVASAQYKPSEAPVRKVYKRKEPESKPYERKTYDKKPYERKPYERKPYEKKSYDRKPIVSKKDLETFKEMADDLVGTRGAYILDKTSEILGKVPTAELESTLKDITGVYAVIFDGEVTLSLAKTADRKYIKYLVGMTSKVNDKDFKTKIFSKDQL